MTDDNAGAPFKGGGQLPDGAPTTDADMGSGGDDRDSEKDDRKDQYKRRLYYVFGVAAASVALLVVFGPEMVRHPSGYMFTLFAVPLLAIIMAGLIASWSGMPLVVSRQQGD